MMINAVVHNTQTLRTQHRPVIRRCRLMGHLWNRCRGNAGVSYVEYFILAAAATAAALTFWDGGNYQGLVGSFNGVFSGQMNHIQNDH